MGSLFGTTKLASRISPGKTLLGALGGVVCCTCTCILAFALANVYHEGNLLPPLLLLHQMVLGIFLGIVSVLGDLIESYIKRMAAVKDSGSFFPGHGGCLDRMDSLLVTAPFLYFWTLFFVSE